MTHFSFRAVLLSVAAMAFADSALAQTPVIGGVVNVASFQNSLSPGTDAAVVGTNLASPSNTPVSVTLGGVPCGVFGTSPNQLNVQLPVNAPLGTSNIVVTHDGLTSAPFPVTINAYAPAFFTTDGNNGYFFDGTTQISPTTPAHVGDTLTGLAVGLGTTNPPVPTGQPAPSAAPFAATIAQPVVTVGGQIAPLELSELAPGSVGFYQINFTLPPGLYGTQNVTLEIGGITSPPVLITIAAPATIATNTGTTPQSANLGTGFATELSVTVTDAGGAPVPGAVVTFTAPASGASAAFAYGQTTATTNNAGVATLRAFANGTAGAYNVTASTAGLAQTATFALTNTSPSSTPNTLTVNVSPLGLGIASPVSGQSYANGAVVPLTATPGPSSTFTGWAGPVANPKSALTSITMDGNESVQANFTGQIFSDVPSSDYFFDGANLMSLLHVTTGCGASIYCPFLQVSRAQMAVFIVRAVMQTDNFTYTQTPYFTDVPPGSFGYQWVQKLRDLGITTGCGATTFCPNDPVTRAQMAVFIIRARYGSAAAFDYSPAPYFSDVPANAFAFGFIQRMKRDHITNGCGPTSYCPNNPVTRGDMSIFIVRAGYNFLLPPADPVLTGVSPTTIAPGGTATVSVSGANTHFDQASTVVQPIPGFTVGAVTVTSPTTLTVVLTAGSNPTIQPESIWVTDAAEEAVLPNVISIQ